MSDQNICKSNELVCTEPDELGRTIVYKDGTFYYKNTYKMGIHTAIVMDVEKMH